MNQQTADAAAQYASECCSVWHYGVLPCSGYLFVAFSNRPYTREPLKRTVERLKVLFPKLQAFMGVYQGPVAYVLYGSNPALPNGVFQAQYTLEEAKLKVAAAEEEATTTLTAPMTFFDAETDQPLK